MSDGFDLLQRSGDDTTNGKHTIVFEPPGKDRVSISVLVGNAVEDFLETGQVLWPAAPILAYFLLSDPGTKLIKGRDVIELGAGIGIPGIIAGKYARSVVLTDHNLKVLNILSHNIMLNPTCATSSGMECSSDTDCNISASLLDWTSSSPSNLSARFDVAIGADVVYAPGAAADLFATVSAVLSSSSESIFILAHVSRSDAARRPRPRPGARANAPSTPAGGRLSTRRSGPPRPPRASSCAPPWTPPRPSRQAARSATLRCTSSRAAIRRPARTAAATTAARRRRTIDGRPRLAKGALAARCQRRTATES